MRARRKNRKIVKDENERKVNKKEEQEEQVQNKMKGCKQNEEQWRKPLSRCRSCLKIIGEDHYVYLALHFPQQ